LLAGRWNRRALLAIPVLMTVELLVFAGQYQPTFRLGQYEGQIEAVARCLSPLPPDVRVAASDQGQLMMAGRLNSWGDDPMMLRRYVEFIANSLDVDPNQMNDTPMQPHSDSRLLRLVRMAGVLILDQNGAHLSAIIAPPLPRAELVGNARVEPDLPSLLAAMNDPKFDPESTAIIESPLPPIIMGMLVRSRAHPYTPCVTVRDLDSDTLDIEAWTNSSCLLVVTDSFSTGWHAEALPDSDQQSYEVVPADLTLRGVPLSEGHHHFRMIYRPMAYVIGKWTSLVAIVAYLAITAIWWRRKKPIPS
jgi:hypothetical protein